MKKLFASLLVLCLLLPAAVAESPVDVKSMTDDELKALYVSVKDELMERKLWESSKIPAGVYVGGKNLPEGYYEITMAKSEDVIAWRTYEDYLQNTNQLLYTNFDEGERFIMALVDGICYSIPCECVIRPYIGIDF